jgi:hypothetical protein
VAATREILALLAALRAKVFGGFAIYTPGGGIDTAVCDALPGAIVMSSLRDFEMGRVLCATAGPAGESVEE